MDACQGRMLSAFWKRNILETQRRDQLGQERRAMPTKTTKLHRRRFLKSTLAAAGATAMAPTIIPSSALGLDGAVAPSERIIVGGIGIGNRGTYDLGCFLEQKDVQFAAVCDVKEVRRLAVKKRVDELYGNQSCL